MQLDTLPHISLAHLPTPLEPLPRLSQAVGGATLWVKRDDQTGLATGGNKTRKLEWLVGEALAQGATTLVTGGAIQSNHCRQTAAAAARVGLGCHLILGGSPPARPQGNVLLDELFGARLHWTPRERRDERLHEVVSEVAEQGEQPYLIPYGGSNAVGATGYVAAMLELRAQLDSHGVRPERIVVASSSGGTQAGMVVGARAAGLGCQILGIQIDKDEGAAPFAERLAALANQTATRVGLAATFDAADFALDDTFLGGGYAVVGELERAAIRQVARTEGLLLDPVYSGRAMGALLALLRRGTIGQDETVLFWHTGGTPALFAYADTLA